MTTTTAGAELSRAEVRVLLAMVAAGQVSVDTATDLLYAGPPDVAITVRDIVHEAIAADEKDVIDRVSRVVEAAIAHAVVRHVSRQPTAADALRVVEETDGG